MSNLNITRNKYQLIILILATIISIAVSYWKLGFGLSFWIIFIIWIILFLVSILSHIIKVAYILWIAILIAFSFSMLVSFRIFVIEKNVQTASNGVIKSSDGIILDDCTSTMNDSPVAITGWKSTIYSGALSKTTSPDVDEANNVRTFSYKGITDKSETNSLYSRIETTDNSNMTGYGTAMEVCSTDNKTTKSYTTAENTYVAGENVRASTHYFHGGTYLHGTGDYRVDVYVKTLDGQWHLIDRLNGIKITK